MPAIPVHERSAMKIHFELNIPYSLKEIFSRQSHIRAHELRKEAEEVFEGNAAKFLCRPNKNLGNKTPLELSVESKQGHDNAMNLLGQIKYGVYI
jgi:uncharacterized protein (DUF2384 family)